MSDDIVLRIEVNKGGYGVYVLDPKISAANSDPKKPYQNPWVEYNIPTVEKVCAFVAEVLPMLKPTDQSTAFDAAFARAVQEDKTGD